MRTDYYNKLLTISTSVAFNYQGSVRRGVIVKIKPNKDRMGRRYPKIYGIIFIINHIQSDGRFVESKVRNIEGIISLDKE